MGQIAIRVKPRSAEPGIGGWRTESDGREALEVLVAEAPADGAANAAVLTLLAKALGLPKSQVRIVSGERSRHKRIDVPLDAKEVRRRLA